MRSTGSPEISDFEKKRAANLVWNSAGDYRVRPPMYVYGEDGEAALYWNTVIGAACRLYDTEEVRALYASFRDRDEELLWESLFWIGTECAVSRAESVRRPVFPYLRRAYAGETLETLGADAVRENAGTGREDAGGAERAERILAGHLSRILSEGGHGAKEPRLPACDLKLLDRLESLGDPERDAPDAARFSKELKAILSEEAGYTEPGSGKEEGEDRRDRFPFFSIFPSFLMLFEGKKRRKKLSGPLRRLAIGFGERVSGEAESFGGSQDLFGGTQVRTEKQTEEDLRQFICRNFGRQILPDRELKRLEGAYCTGIHEKARIYITRGEYTPELLSHGVAYHIQEDALRQHEANLKSFRQNEGVYMTAVRQLTEQLRNSLLMYLDEREVRAAAGRLKGGTVWRGLYLDDRNIFSKDRREEKGRITVDLLLDASRSQTVRNRLVSAQGYMIAESLTRCGIPCRVCSFCSLNGYTVVNLFRDYNETDRNMEIFRYFTAGANRDGLAVRLAAGLMKENRAEHRLLIILSDCKPNDPLTVRTEGGAHKNYELEPAVSDTAAEVHWARLDGISVMCVYTGRDEETDAAKKIYGQEFVRIRSLDRFADRVGQMLKREIEML